MVLYIFGCRSIAAADCISQLPASLLLEILEKLSLREAVQTRLLSKIWNQISKSRKELLLDWKMMRCTSKVVDCLRDSVKFVRAVDQYLNSLRGLHSKAFMLTFCLSNQWARHIDQWINIAVGLGIESLFLHFSCRYMDDGYDDSDTYVFHAKHFQQDSKLVVLSIRSCILAVGPKLFNLFGSLLKLTLCDVFLRADLVDYLCAHTEQLLCLELCLCSFPDDQQLYFSSSSLRELRIICCLGSYTVVVHRCINLVTMDYYGEGSQLSIIEAPRLEALCIGLDNEIVIPCVPGLCYLRLTHPSSGINLSSSFSYEILDHLVLEFLSSEFEFRPIILLLQHCPSLKIFRISARCSQKDTEEDLDSEMHLLSHRSLETVKIFGFSNNFNHLQLAKFCLSHCVKLEELNIRPWTSYQELSEFDLNGDLLFLNKKIQNPSRKSWDKGELAIVCRKLQGFPKHAALRIWFPHYGLMKL